MSDRKITRRAEFSSRAIIEGVATLPEGVTYFTDFERYQAGEFPHGATDEDTPCPADLWFKINGGPGGGFTRTLQCTAAGDHDTHIAHIMAGMPMAAWTDEEPSA